jgi:hypothetical protein
MTQDHPTHYIIKHPDGFGVSAAGGGDWVEVNGQTVFETKALAANALKAEGYRVFRTAAWALPPEEKALAEIRHIVSRVRTQPRPECLLPVEGINMIGMVLDRLTIKRRQPTSAGK